MIFFLFQLAVCKWQQQQSFDKVFDQYHYERFFPPSVCNYIKKKNLIHLLSSGGQLRFKKKKQS